MERNKENIKLTPLRKMQLIQTDMLKSIHEICVKNDITYYMFGGTLIGAVRHKGFIPWDDDLDIAMPRKDYIRFEQIANKQLPEHIRFYTGKTDKGIHVPLGKVRNNNTKAMNDYHRSIMLEHTGFWIDVFPLDDVKSENSIILKLQVFISKKILARITYYQSLRAESCFNIKQKLQKKIFGNRKNDKWINLNCKILQWQNNKGYKYYIAFSSHYHYRKQIIPKEKYGAPILLEFEGNMFNAPCDYDYVLKHVYGDYMKIPPKEERIGHDVDIQLYGDEYNGV